MRWVHRPLVQLLVAAAVVHVVLLLVVWNRDGSIDAYALKSLDCREYLQIAQNLAEHGAFSQDAAAPLRPDTWRTPGYPLFLAIPVFLFGASVSLLILIQQVLSILSVLLLFGIARGWMSDRRAQIVAGLFLIEPYHLYYSLWLLAATLFVALLLTTWWAWERAWRVGSVGWFACAGASCGALVLIRPVAVLVPIVLLAVLIVGSIRHRSKQDAPPARKLSWRAPCAFAAMVMVVVGSWMVRNRAVAGHFALSHQGGVVLAYFKATEVRLWREGRTADRYVETSLDADRLESPHTVWEDIDHRLRAEFSELPEDDRAELRWQNLAQGNKTVVDSFAVSSALAKIGRSELLAAPLSTAACFLVRCGSLLTFPLNLAMKPPGSVVMHRGRAAALGLAYTLLCVFVVARLLRRGVPFAGVCFPLACCVALLLATTPQLDPRFRVPIIPLVLVIACLPDRTCRK